MDNNNKRKRDELGEDQAFIRSVKPKLEIHTDDSFAKVFECLDTFGAIMKKLKRPNSLHDLPNRKCIFLNSCYCDHAFSFCMLRMVSKSMYEMCGRYKDLPVRRPILSVETTASIKSRKFHMDFGLLCLHSATEGYLECLKFSRSIKAPWTPKNNEKHRAYYSSYVSDKYSKGNSMPFPFNRDISDWIIRGNALVNGHPECEEYARSQGCAGSDVLLLERMAKGFTCGTEQIYASKQLRRAHTYLLAYVVIGGNINFLEEVLHIDGARSLPVIMAIEHGRLDMLKLLLSKLIVNTSTFQFCPTAARHGRLECLKYLQTKNFAMGNSIYEAARGGHLECIKCIGGPFTVETLNNAVWSGSRECINYLLDNECPFDASTLIEAAKQGNLECIKMLVERNCPWNMKVTEEAAWKFECVKFLIDKGCPADEEVYFATQDIRVVKYAHEHGIVWNEFVPSKFVEYDQRELLVYAIENKCPMSQTACSYAAKAGNLRLLKYLRDNDCPWDWNVVLSACKVIEERCGIECEEYRDIVKYAAENNCPTEFIKEE